MVVMTGFSYFPAVTYAVPGDTIRFINESGEAQTVVGKDSGWSLGPLQDQASDTLTVSEETELKFFAAYQCTSECEGEEEQENPGNYDEAPIKAEISFSQPPLNG